MISCKNCSSNSIIEDYSVGEYVCTSCGAVCGQIYLPNNCHGTTAYTEYEIMPFVVEDEPNSRHRQNITDYFNYLLIQSTELIENAIKIFHTVCRRLKTEKKCRISKKLTNVIYAYSMYEACNLAHCPRYLEEFCSVCQVRKTKVLQLEKTLQLSHSHCPTVNYVERTVDLLGLPYWMREAVEAIVNNTAAFDSYKSMNLISAIIITICRQFQSWLKMKENDIKNGSVLMSILKRHRRGLGQFSPSEWTVSKVCVETGTNSGVVYKIMRELQEVDIFSILNSSKRV